MKIILIQTDIKWQDPQGNRAHLDEIIKGLPETELIILPEMFTTGFSMSPEQSAETAGTDTLLWMQIIAERKNTAIAGSIAVKENGNYYNRMYFVYPCGNYAVYDKRHLFSYAGEDEYYTPGDKRVIIEYRGFRILLQICYDVRFPVFARNRCDYDMIIYVANWPHSRRNAWDTLIRARAIENQCYVAAVNRTGEDPVCRYSGGTVLVDYLGNIITGVEDNVEKYLSSAIDLEPLVKFRNKFPAWKDADYFNLVK